MAKEKISRRGFIKVSGTTALGATLIPTFFTRCTSKPYLDPGKVVLSRNPAAAPDIDTIEADIVQHIVDDGIKTFSGKNSVGEAWRTFFPGITANSKIGLKINVVAGTRPRQLCTQVHTVEAIVNGLSQMQVDGASFPASNVVVWDRWNDELEGAGFSIRETGPGYLCFGTTATMNELGSNIGYDGDAPWQSKDDTAYFSKIVSKLCDYQINVPVLKSMGTGGMTFGMKNMYGTFSTAYPEWGEIGTIYHEDFPTRMCDVNQAELISKKFVLHVGDALLGKAIGRGGPAGPADFAFGGVMFCNNPVSMDTIAADIVREQGEEVTDAVWQQPAEQRGLGFAAREKIRLITV